MSIDIGVLLQSMIDPGGYLQGIAATFVLAAAMIGAGIVLSKQASSSKVPFAFYSLLGAAAYMGLLNEIAQ